MSVSRVFDLVLCLLRDFWRAEFLLGLQQIILMNSSLIWVITRMQSTGCTRLLSSAQMIDLSRCRVMVGVSKVAFTFWMQKGIIDAIKIAVISAIFNVTFLNTLWKNRSYIV